MFQRLQSFCETAMSRFFYAAPLCLLAGALGALSMAPLSAWYVLPVSFSVLYMALAFSSSKKAAFFYGWLFGFAYFVFGLSWIGNALLVEGNDYKWAWPLAVSGLPAVLAFFTGVSALISKAVFKLKSVSGFFGFVGVFGIFELLRGVLFTGFPWNLYGYAWAGTPEMLQILFYSDAYFLSFLTIFWTGAFSLLFVLPAKRSLPVILIALLSAALCFGFGSMRLQNASQDVNENIQIKIVQPNINQSEKWQRDKMVNHFAHMIEQSKATAEDIKTTYIVWPETAMSYWLMNDPGVRGTIKAMLYSYPNGASLFTGLLDFKPETQEYTNSLVMLNRDARIVNQYDKSHLVPFGEYIPFQNYIPLAPVAQFQGFKTGGGPETPMTEEGLSYSPLICYEILFPHKAVEKDQIPDFIVNVTNDGWYGMSAGPYQHLTKAVFRAIETGVPVIRSANTGISTVVSPYGGTITPSALFESAVTTYELPAKIESGRFSTGFKLALFLLATGCFIIIGWLSRLPK